MCTVFIEQTNHATVPASHRITVHSEIVQRGEGRGSGELAYGKEHLVQVLQATLILHGVLY